MRIRNKIVKAMLVVMSLSWACKSPQPVAYQYQEPEGNSARLSEIVFLTFRIYEDSTASASVELLEKQIVGGKIKVEGGDSQEKNRIVVKQFDKQKIEVNAVAINHPLFKQVEVTNNTGSYETKYLQLADAEFFVRLTLLPQTVFIRVDEVREEKEIKSTWFTIR